MKLPITTFTFSVLIATSSLAGDFTKSEQERCDEMSDVAEMIMENRQLGVSMSKQIRVFNNNSSDSRALWYEVVSEAYKRPRFSTSENREKIVTDFGNAVYQECYQAMTGK